MSIRVYHNILDPVRKKSEWSPYFTDSVSQEGKAIGSVRLSFRLSVCLSVCFHLSFEPTDLSVSV